jgi:hypothetical protein
MRNLIFLFATTFFVVTAVSAVVYAGEPSDSMVGKGMTSGGMMGGGMMGGDMMRQMNHRMGCGSMMHGTGRPNEQWRNGPTPAPGDQE